MTRRASLPGADELFRNTAEESRPPAEQTRPEPAPTPDPQAPVQQAPVQQAPVQQAPVQQAPVPQPPKPPKDLTPQPPGPEETGVLEDEGPSGHVTESPRPQVSARPKHEEKVTFYCTPEELTRLERARLALRADHRIATDRGRIIRAALAEILEEFERNGSESLLIPRLRSKRKR